MIATVLPAKNRGKTVAIMKAPFRGTRPAGREFLETGVGRRLRERL
jgi:hypothetical protein